MYIIEGNIGAGKSTFLNMIKNHNANLSVALEPLHEWQDQLYGQSLLTSFYENAKRWAYSFEHLTLVSRVKNHLQEQQLNIPFRIVERSIYSGYYVFARNSYESGFLTPLEWKIYQESFEMLTKNKCQLPSGFIYLRVDPEKAFERIKKRNRHAEKEMSLSYLRQIHHKHERFLLHNFGITKEIATIPTLIIDVNEEFETNSIVQKKHLDAIMCFINETQNRYKTHSSEEKNNEQLPMDNSI